MEDIPNILVGIDLILTFLFTCPRNGSLMITVPQRDYSVDSHELFMHGICFKMLSRELIVSGAEGDVNLSISISRSSTWSFDHLQLQFFFNFINQFY